MKCQNCKLPSLVPSSLSFASLLLLLSSTCLFSSDFSNRRTVSGRALWLWLFSFSFIFAMTKSEEIKSVKKRSCVVFKWEFFGVLWRVFFYNLYFWLLAPLLKVPRDGVRLHHGYDLMKRPAVSLAYTSNFVASRSRSQEMALFFLGEVGMWQSTSYFATNWYSTLLLLF